MKYDERACKFNMDTGCVELLLRDERKISINCTGVEDALDVTMAQRSELDYLICNDPLGYADLILNGAPEEYLKNVAGSCSSTQPVSMLNLQALASYFILVSFLPYGTFTVVTFVIRLFDKVSDTQPFGTSRSLSGQGPSILLAQDRSAA